MTIQIGDVVFTVQGRPGIVVDKDPKTEELKVETKGEAFENARKRNFMNGLTPQMRDQYNEILDEIRDEKEPQEKLKLLAERIEEVGADPKNHIVTKYLTAQKAHIMNSNRINPRVYKIDQDSLR